MKSQLHTGASLALRIKYETGEMKVIGFATNFSYTVSNGQKATFVVDSPLPAEIAQSAAGSMVRGSMTLFLPKGTTPESAGLVPFRTNLAGDNVMAASRYCTWEIFDRFTQAMVLSTEYCKVGTYSVSVAARGVVQMNLTFEGILATPGSSI